MAITNLFAKLKKQSDPNAPKPLKIHVSNSGGVWVDPDELSEHPKIKRQLAMRLVNGIPVYEDWINDMPEGKS